MTRQSPGETAAGHELVDHTSEITLRLRAPTFPGLIAEATRAFAELVPASMRADTTAGRREIEVGGVDRVATLVEWLNEIVYLCEAERWMPVELEAVEESAGGLRIRAKGVDLITPFVLVKAATLYRASVAEGPDGLVAEVTLDV